MEASDYIGKQQVQQPMFKVEGPHIVFGNGVMRKKQNFTVRLGANYMEERGLEVGKIVTLTTVDGGYIGDGTITHSIVCKLKNIPAEVFKNEHDPDCVNPIGLYYELMLCYSDKGPITPETFVTCIGFTVSGNE
jgi:hypothetical protein